MVQDSAAGALAPTPRDRSDGDRHRREEVPRNRLRGINAQYVARNAPRHHDARDASTSGDVRSVGRRNREEIPAAQKQQREDHCEADSMGSC